MSPDPRLISNHISTLLGPCTIGSSIDVVDTATSTNDLALERAREGAPHGSVVIALNQTAGRGRMGRIWESHPGDSLCMSVVLRPGSPMREAGRLTLHAGLAVHRALTRLTGLPLRIKWPNDILWESHKLCGILTESASRDGRAAHVVVGIGCNLNQTETRFPVELRARARSLAQLTGRPWEIPEVAAAILAELAAILDLPWMEVLTQWKSRCTGIGSPATIHTGMQTLTAVLRDIDADGALVLEHPDGSLQRLESAEIL